ncbi:glucosyltransferase I RfaG [Pectobacterium brasiliense]|uniref:glycosyltransferase family 4 protein n=1 Tax=Pectobacterium brasiliense TaxID=180957 RepID=UPI0001A430DE|nr:glycosyltransferase family 4 protein [Pectobacterium brasiliense]KGA22511.1 glucosyltransferase I RfaG [Pectobacterium brasiliense]KRF65871.1 glucosyltransferase I RfaG [Pectobacterium brasiliense]MBN3186884.1 glycosyltransferase family 4 protein [Pectobacterium brasiliense]QHG27670.1 glycosyltransferase [Pectobacterium brasiliense]
MKIAFCVYKFFPFGGLQRDFLSIALTCQKQGHDIRVYTSEWQGDKPEGFDIVLVPISGLGNHTRHRRFSDWIQRHLQQSPVDRVVGFSKMPGLDFYYAAEGCTAEKAVQEKCFFYRLTPRYRGYAALERDVFDKNSHTRMLMLTPRQIAHFQKHYGTQDERFFMLPPGISLDRKYSTRSPATRSRFRQQNQLDENGFVLLQVGSDFKRKGVGRSLAAIASLPQELRQRVTLLVVGQDDPKPFQQQAEQLGIGKQIQFFSGRDDIPNFMAAADLLLHPAHQEAAGIVLLEAIAAGLPILVTDACGYAFYIERSRAGQVIPEPFSQTALNHALSHALRQPETLKQWAENARHFADTEDIYSLPEKAAQLITSANAR